MTTIQLCEVELTRYMRLITGEIGNIELYSEEGSAGFDEHFEIDVSGGSGYIRANRPRALLIGVYEFLRRLGCRFIRPGKDGEVIPEMLLKDVTVKASVTPANRHRGITIEGSVSLENVLDIIEWAPKVGFNSYFIQFRTAFEFFNRWYTHARNESIAPEEFSENDSMRFVKKIIEKIKERDMVYHAVGHGWSAACIDISSNGWGGVNDELTDKQRSFLAEIGGERKFFNGIPLNTNLCYSNPEVRERLTEEVVSYAKAHPEIDVLHFWLADDSNNVCECEECSKKLLADWYVPILNDIDERMTKLKLKTKICFLVYLDLYWAPQNEKINNPDRFIMMFAPIFRSYAKPYDCTNSGVRIEYVRNKVKYPHETSPYVNFLKDWQKIFKGDCFDFDYHLMWDINRDFGGETLAKVLYEDIRTLPAFGLNGFLSCQLQRAFYPNGLAFYLLGRTLFDGELSYEEIRAEYYNGAFGKYAEFASGFYNKIEELVSFLYMKEEQDGQTALPGFKSAQTYLTRVLGDFPNDLGTGIYAESMEILRFLAENLIRLLNVLVLKIEGEDEEKIKAADLERKAYFNANEKRFQPYADGFYVNMIVDGIVAAREVGIYA